LQNFLVDFPYHSSFLSARSGEYGGIDHYKSCFHQVLHGCYYNNFILIIMEHMVKVVYVLCLKIYIEILHMTLVFMKYIHSIKMIF
jgi:hypothetical protein